MFRQDLKMEFAQFCLLMFCRVMKLNLGRDSEARFGQDFEVEVQASGKILKLELVSILPLM